MARHRTSPADAVVSETGWAKLPSGREVTRLPVIDTTRTLPDGSHLLFARLTYADALTVAAREGARLISPETLVELGNVGLQLTPFLGTPIAETDLVHSQRHDADVWRQLHALDWDGKQPVSGAGKHWVSGAPEGRSRLMGWDRDGAGPGKALWQPLQVAHDRNHHDDGTTTMLERDGCPDTDPSPRRAPPPSKPGDPPERIKAWQQWLLAHGYALPKYGADGKQSAGGETSAATARALAEHPEWVATATSGPTTELPLLPFRQAKHYYASRRGGQPLWVVMHTAESLEVKGGAEELQAYAATTTRQVSWHYAISSHWVGPSVREEHTAFAAPGANARGVQIELCGYARQTAMNWADAYSTRQLGIASALVAEICARWHIPLVKVGAREMLAGLGGICGHADVTAGVGKGKTTHSDPGVSFPWQRFLELVRVAS